MTERIQKLTELTLAGKMYVEAKNTEFERNDIFLSECERDAKRICEYISDLTARSSELLSTVRATSTPKSLCNISI